MNDQTIRPRQHTFAKIQGCAIKLSVFSILLLSTGCANSLIDNTLMETMYDFNYCYDVEDEWKSPKRTLATCGDCEDFAILFRQRLLDQGISADRINLVSGRLDGGFKFDDEYTQRSFSRKFTEVSDERHMVLQVDGYYYDQNGFHWDFPELEDKMFEKMKSFLHDGIYYRNPVREYEPRATEYNRAD